MKNRYRMFIRRKNRGAANIVARKTDETRRRWNVAIKDRNFDCIRNLRVAETRPEHFDRALADGKVSTNVYFNPIHCYFVGVVAAGTEVAVGVVGVGWVWSGSMIAPAGHWCVTTMIGSVRLDGTTACMTIEAATDTDIFRALCAVRSDPDAPDR
jgi:hypothetical protein